MLNIDGYGRIASDVPLNRSKNGKSLYTNFLLASHNKRKETTFIRCVAFDAMATLLNTFFTKGDRIVISGELVSDDYNSSKNKFAFEIKVTGFEFVESSKEHNKNKNRRKKDGQRSSNGTR